METVFNEEQDARKCDRDSFCSELFKPAEDPQQELQLLFQNSTGNQGEW